ncbi:MAG TPA: D-alanine--D-alanine ligase [bacterium]|nr:D-alanine--D-alanine ligase [bacterium]
MRQGNLPHFFIAMRVGLTYNLKKQTVRCDGSLNDHEAEWDDQETIDAIISAISRHHTAIPIEADLGAFDALKRSRPDIVFNIAEGAGGPHREACIPAMLEMLAIPYTGSDPTTLGICLDKGRTKEALQYHRIPTPAFELLESADACDRWRSFPAIVKPLWEGSSKGVRNSSFVATPDELRLETERIVEAYRQPAIVEAFLSGREFTVAVIGNGAGARALPAVEISFDSLPPMAHKIYSYEAKWVWDVPGKPLDIFSCPAQVDAQLGRRIAQTALDAFRALRCRDWCRIDIRLDDDCAPNIIELNPLPGILPKPEDNSCFPKAARAAGMDYAALINTVLNTALQRCRLLDPSPSAR